MEGPFLRYTHQDLLDGGQRGARAVGLPAWVMGMASLPIGKSSQIAFRAMITGEPFTEGSDGYPLLFQTGETHKGIPNVDWQHPHDLIAEISATYSLTRPNGTVYYFYLALPGEPAIGPPAFMHRPSSSVISDAPLGHHWQDATHVTFGVVTAGAIKGPFKLDVSLFSGREPDEDRLDFDQPVLNSYSGRLAWNPAPNWAIQASSGFISSPEIHSPDTDIWRTSASVLYGRKTEKQYTALSLVWGLNNPITNSKSDQNQSLFHTHTQNQHAILLEGMREKQLYSIFSRVEVVQKEAEELRVGGNPDGVPLWIGSGMIGAARKFYVPNAVQLDAGLQLTVYKVPELLQNAYGSMPFSGQIFLRANIH